MRISAFDPSLYAVGALALAALGLTIGRAASADETGCTILFESMNRQVTTPNHQYLSQSGADGAAVQSEIINTGTARYMLRNGKWLAVPESPADLLKREQDNEKNSKSTCRLVREETIDGTSTSVYSEHSETEAHKSDGIVWITKASGLPVREQIDLDTGGGASGKRRIEIRIVYSGVTPPAGFK